MERQETLKLAFKLLQRLCRKPAAAHETLPQLPLDALQIYLAASQNAALQFYAAQLIKCLRPYAAPWNLPHFRPAALPALAERLHLRLVAMEKMYDALLMEPPPCLLKFGVNLES